MELQLQVTEEELQEFPEIRSDPTNINHIEDSTSKAILGTEKSNPSTAPKIKPEKLQYK